MNSSDSDFLLKNITSSSECESFNDSDDRENMSDYSNASSIDNNPAGWKIIGDSIKDRLPNQVTEVLGIPCPNTKVFPHEDVSFTRSVDMFLSEETFNFIVRCTNLRAELYFKLQLNFKIHVLQWHNVTLQKMKNVFGCLVNMELDKKSQLSMY
ncbi:unnamed protein product [Psylliodes chrysocephalus]|uniref:Uncharacterized protein n=1 Tax=Psylliodes chrysocephalus TaxID=3402493 RepID=A0A9P0CYB6_9CUCU|nr:unnamed protein product [Psylliodes chrysocephala]